MQGGAANQITIYYGLADGTGSGGWNQSMSLGLRDQGAFDTHLQGLDSGKTYYYRFLADNSQTAWSNAGSFTTLRFDQGIVRINTGVDDFGTNAGIFWDRNNGEGEQKKYLMPIFQPSAIKHRMVLPGKFPKLLLKLVRIYFLVRI